MLRRVTGIRQSVPFSLPKVQHERLESTVAGLTFGTQGAPLLRHADKNVTAFLADTAHALRAAVTGI